MGASGSQSHPIGLGMSGLGSGLAGSNFLLGGMGLQRAGAALPFLSGSVMSRLLPQPSLSVLNPSFNQSTAGDGGAAAGSSGGVAMGSMAARISGAQVRDDRKRMIRLVWQDPKEKTPSAAVTSFCGEMNYLAGAQFTSFLVQHYKY